MTPSSPGYIKTACRKCGQHIEAPEEYGGSFVSCPTCGGTVAVPEAASAAPPPSPQRTQRIAMPPPPPPSAPLPQPHRTAPSLPVSAIPPTPILDAYLLPVLLFAVGVATGAVCGAMEIPITHPIPFYTILLLAAAETVLLLGHLGAIAARLKTIEALLRAPR